MLDVNLDGLEINPVADILAGRGLPFVFVTGYGERNLPERFRDRPALQKPFQAEQLQAALAGLLATAEALPSFLVMPALVAGIHAFRASRRGWPGQARP